MKLNALIPALILIGILLFVGVRFFGSGRIGVGKSAQEEKDEKVKKIREEMKDGKLDTSSLGKYYDPMYLRVMMEDMNGGPLAKSRRKPKEKKRR